MRKLVVAAVAFAAAVPVGCTPEIEQVTPTEVVVARFDPSANPPVVPTPNDLATDRSSGLLKVSSVAGASPADEQFVAWLNTLNGFPASSSGGATFTGELDPASVGEGSVHVFDVTDGLSPVTGTALSVVAPAESDGDEAKTKLQVTAPAGGWKPDHTYAVALVSGSEGLKSKDGQRVMGSATWALIRSEKSLVTCQDLSSTECRSTTEVIPSKETDPAKRIQDQTAKAVLLEQLRLKYKPVIDTLLASGVKRDDIALAWSFRVHAGPIALFNPAANPPQVPVPNDLAIDPTTGLVKAPIDPNAPAAQQEFTRDYLNTLDGFPISADADATVIGGALNPSTVNAQTVQVIDLDLAGGAAPVTPTIAWDANRGHLVISPPETGWMKGHRYAIALTTALESQDGTALASGDVWALARSSEPLVDCVDLSATSCKSVLRMAPISNAQAVALEGLRRGFKPVLDALELKGLKRENLALLWTFKVVGFSEATFDPGNSVIPFPNNLLLKPGSNPPQVNIPLPDNASPLQQMLISGLNTLDGFSTTGPFISENSKTLGALDQGRIDPGSLQAGTGFLSLTPGVTPPDVTACLDCQSSLEPDGTPQTDPQTLQFVTHVPLDERSTYAAYLTSGLLNDEGRKVVAAPAFALIRMQSPLVDASGKSQVNGVADEDAAKLEPVRQGLKPLVDAIAAAGIPRSELALAWAFRTQTTQTQLEQLHGLPTQLGNLGALPAAPVFAYDASNLLPGLAVPNDKIGRLFMGTLYLPWVLTGPGTTLNPTAPEVRKAPYTLVLPQGTPPASGWPVTIFGHGLGRHRNDVLALANTLAAAGHAVIAVDHVFHGDRSTCVGLSDAAACADPNTQTCNVNTGRCVAKNPAAREDCSAAATGSVPGDLYCTMSGKGLCLADQKCEGGDFRRDAAGTVMISSNKFLDTLNLFATRDHFRAPVADLAQVERILLQANATGGLNDMLQLQQVPAGPIDPSQITYAGQSLGGMVGTLFTSASPVVERSFLNVPGADLAEILLTADAFASTRQAFLATLASQNITPGTPAFDEFIGLAKWILGPSDPQNAAYWMLNRSTAPMSRRVFLQYIQDDAVIPNPTTEILLAGMNRSTGKAAAVYQFNPTLAQVPYGDRHGFLLNFKHPATTVTAQTQAATFLSTGATP